MRKTGLGLTCVATLLALAAPALAGDASLSGKWLLTITSPQGTRTPTMVLTQTGEQVAGTYQSKRGEAPIAGELKGSQFRLTVKLANPQSGQELTLVYSGTLTGDALTGTLDLGQMGKAEFSGKRIP